MVSLQAAASAYVPMLPQQHKLLQSTAERRGLEPVIDCCRYELERQLLDGKVTVNELPALWNERMTEYLGCTPRNDAEGILQDVHWSAGIFGYFPTYSLGAMYACQIFEVSLCCTSATRLPVVIGKPICDRQAAARLIGCCALDSTTLSSTAAAPHETMPHTNSSSSVLDFLQTAWSQLPDLDSDIAKGNFAPLKKWLNEHIHKSGSFHANGKELMKAVTGSPLNPEVFLKYLRQKYSALYKC